METGKPYEIHCGPNKFNLSVALLRGQKNVDDVDFVINLTRGNAGDVRLTCSVTSITLEGSDRESWLIMGYAKGNKSNGMRQKYEAHFNTMTRKGELKLVD